MTTRVGWLPAGKRAACIFHVDDVHPGTSSDAYEAGGDLGAGALGHIAWLLERHPQLSVTLFTTADWREISAFPTRRLLARVPGLRERVYLAPVLPKGTMRLDRHPAFVDYVRRLPRTEVALHGLHHINTGPRIPVEFEGRTQTECRAMLREALAIFAAAGLPPPAGMQPPAWAIEPPLARAMHEVGLSYVCSARDVRTPVAPEATTNMSGLSGVPLFAPSRTFDETLIHFPTNFQATSHIERALAIVEQGGLLSIKGHIVKNGLGHVSLDGIDPAYTNYLDLLFTVLEERYGDSLWWPTCTDLARQVSAGQA